MLLGNLIKSANKKYRNTVIKGVSFDSRKIKKGDIFFAILGKKESGNKFIDEADDRIVEKGKEAQSKLKWQDPSIVLFPLYTKLLTCIEGELSMNGIEVPIVLSTVSPEIENIVLKWLKKFKAFCDKAFATGIDNIEKSNESKETGGIFKGKRKGTYLSSMDDASSMRKNKDLNNNNDNFKMPQ